MLFPNPAGEFVNVKIQDETNVIKRIDIINTNGKIIRTLTNQVLNNNECKISLAGIATGIYFIKISNNGWVANKKLIVNSSLKSL